MITLEAIFSVVLLSILWLAQRRRQSQYKLPPGPKGWPIIGNLFDMPPDYPWLTYAAWGKTFGPLTYLNITGIPILIINSHRVALDLLEKRGQIYAGRPRSVMCELIGLNWMSALERFNGDRLRQYRRMSKQGLSPKLIQAEYSEVIANETRAMMHQITNHPEQLLQAIRRCQGRIILSITYGTSEDGVHDLIALGERTIAVATSAATPYAVDAIPLMRYLPRWAPGTDFLRQVEEWKPTILEGYDIPFNVFMRQREKGDTGTSLCGTLLNTYDADGTSEEMKLLIKNVSGTLFAAGTDTTGSLIEGFLVAMVLFPDVQRRAQEEIRKVTGNDRLPSFKDREAIPYINQILLETMRWHSVAPTGSPHQLDQDDTYEGYVIPKGTSVFVNSWYISHDPEVYPNPDTFDPDRFKPLTDLDLKSGCVPPLDPREYFFGYGRRICPGKNLVQSTAWFTIACFLASFELRLKDPEVPFKPEFTYEGTMSRPKHGAYDVIPRKDISFSLSQ